MIRPSTQLTIFFRKQLIPNGLKIIQKKKRMNGGQVEGDQGLYSDYFALHPAFASHGVKGEGEYLYR